MFKLQTLERTSHSQTYTLTYVYQRNNHYTKMPLIEKTYKPDEQMRATEDKSKKERKNN